MKVKMKNLADQGLPSEQVSQWNMSLGTPKLLKSHLASNI